MKALQNIKSVLIIRSGALGDTVYATVVLDALIQQFGEDIKIDWIGIPACFSLFKHDKRVNKIFTLKHRKLPALINPEKRRIISSSKKHPYDLLINLEQGNQFNDLAIKIQAHTKIGSPFTLPKTDPNKSHMVDLIRAMYKDIIDINIHNSSYPKLFGEDFNLVQKKFGLSDNFIVINPSNSHTKRNKINYRAWPVDSWKALINKLPKDENIILLGNKGEESYFKALQPYPKNVIDLSGKTNLSELISIVDQARLMITTDTGPAHIASATSTSVFCLVGPTNPELTGPYQMPENKVHIISKNLDCAPCYDLPHRDQCKNNICMKQITVTDILKSIYADI